MKNNILMVGHNTDCLLTTKIVPKIIQENHSFIITDPDGMILEETETLLKQNEYRINILNIKNLRQSDHYNPFCYLKDKKDIISFVDCFVQNTTNMETCDKARRGDPDWEKAEKSLLIALILYVKEKCHEKDHNFTKICEFLRLYLSETEAFDNRTKLDAIFEDLEKSEPDHIAIKYWKGFKAADQRIWKRIVITLYVRLVPFAIDYFAVATKDDDLHLEKMKEEKVALFIITPISNDCFNFLATILYTQFIGIQNKEKERNRKNNIDLMSSYSLSDHPDKN